MAAVEEVVKEIDKAINNAKALFDDQFQTMKTRQQEPGPIAFSTGTKLTQQCVRCNNEIVNYAIFGRWVEGNPEGEATISWKCGTCKKQYVFRNTRSKVIDNLLHLSFPRGSGAA
jgi:heterodisulfide reductase subunit A-like polyferredoxin